MHGPLQPRFRLQLLGAPRLTEGDAEHPWPSRRALALLACLAIERRVTRARLADLFWDSLDEASARRNLRRELARLRDAGLGATFDSSGDVLALGVEVGSDVQAFDATDADPEATLAAWRGPLLDGFALADAPRFDDWLTEHRERMLRRWREAAGAAAAACEARGDARAALDIHLRLQAADPLQELHHAHAMRLHYLLGERTAALDVYERCRRLLRDELGLEPLAATSALAERIRAAERLAPLVARRAAALQTELDAPLIGRDAPARRVRDSTAPVVLLVGEPGVGKTRLAQESLLARSTVLLRCEAAATGAALHPVAEALRAALDEPRLVERLASVDPALRREAARLLPALDPTARFGATTAGESAQSGQQRLFEALAALLDALAGSGGALWIDDLHWADESTLALVAHLAHRRARRPAAHVRIVAAARGQELRERAPVSDALRLLERATLLERVALAPLEPEDTLALVRALSGSAQGRLFAARLHKVTHGNPYFLLETIRFLFDAGELRLDDGGAWVTRYDEATSDYAELPVPPSLAATVLERVGRLGAAARRVLEAAALAGAGFTLAQVQPATALSDWEALDGLERALHARLLVNHASGYRFVHELARDALAAQLGTERCRLVHRRLAAAIEAQNGAPDRVAHHLQAAGDAQAARPWWTAAARAAEKVYAWREALAHHQAALAACGDGDVEHRIAAHRARCVLQRRLHDTAAMLAEADALAALDAQRPRLWLAVEAQLWRIRAHNLAETFAGAQAAADAALAESASLPATLRHELRLAVAQTRNGAGDLAGAAALLDEEAALAGELDSAQRLELHLQRASLGMSRNDLDLVQHDAQAALHVSRELQLVHAQGEAANILAYVMHARGDTAAALATLEEAQAQAERAALVGVQRSLLTNLVKLHVLLGQGQAARRRMQQATALFADIDDPATQARLSSREVEVAQLNGELGVALAAARNAVTLLEHIGSAAGSFWPWYQLARLLWQCGDGDAAVAVYRELPRSPAFSELARPAVDFFSVAFACKPALPPHAAKALADALAAVPDRGDHSHYGAEDSAYWRAQMLLQAGHPQQAWALVQALQAPPFTLHPAAVLALRLRAASAAGEAVTDLASRAREALPSVPPLEAIELLAALAQALHGLGDTPGAAQCRREARSRSQALAATLQGNAAQAQFMVRHEALIGT